VEDQFPSRTSATETAIIAQDAKELQKLGYAQELARCVHAFSNFAMSFSVICILAGGITSFPVGFSTAGGFGIGVGWLVGGLFSLVVACSMAQIASAYPTAGGLYHWASILGGRGWGWATAWVNLTGLTFVIASVNVGVFELFKNLILETIFHVSAGHWGVWHQAAGVVILAASQGALNHFGMRLTTKLMDFSGVLIFLVAITLTVAMLFSMEPFDFKRLFTFVNLTGAAGGGVVPRTNSAILAFCLSLLLPLYTITGFDASAHAAEETVNARSSVPKGMLNAVLWSVLFGYVMTCSFVLALHDPGKAARQDGGNIFFHLLSGLPVAMGVKNLLYIGIVVANYFCALAGVTSTSRMVYAFARDGGLPKLLRYVSPTYRTPTPAIWLTTILSVAATLYSPAFTALAAGCAIFLYVSYAMPIAAGLFAEGKAWTEFGPFRLRGLSKPFAIWACSRRTSCSAAISSDSSRC
jgi:amino acid transporter